MIEAVVEFSLAYPYYRNVSVVYDLATAWGMRLVKTTINSDKAYLRVEAPTFKKIFGSNPRPGEFDVPKGLTKFVSSVKVIEVVTDD